LVQNYREDGGQDAEEDKERKEVVGHGKPEKCFPYSPCREKEVPASAQAESGQEGKESRAKLET
jgi:hypothetical protein